MRESKLKRAVALLSGLDETRTPGRCILAAMVATDFLRAVGFADARPLACIVEILGTDPVTAAPRRLICGGRAQLGLQSSPDEYDGHLAVTVDGWLLDPTFGTMKQSWCRPLPATAMVPLLPHTTGIVAVLQRDGYVARWVANPANRRWRRSPFAAAARRKPIVDKMLAAWRTPDAIAS